MWRADIRIETEIHPQGGVAPLRSDLALYHYRQKAKQREAGHAAGHRRHTRIQGRRTEPEHESSGGKARNFYLRALSILGFGNRRS